MARLHMDALPRSVIGLLGLHYVRAFYRYVARSEHEILVVDRDDHGRPVAAAVVSLEPATLTRRLMTGTPLVVDTLLRLHRLVALWAGSWRARRPPPGTGQTQAPSTCPQLILIFTAAAERGKGRGTVVMRELERRLHARGVPYYQVRTESDPSNRALTFYHRRGFTSEGVEIRFGTLFQILGRFLDRPEPMQAPPWGPAIPRSR